MTDEIPTPSEAEVEAAAVAAARQWFRSPQYQAFSSDVFRYRISLGEVTFILGITTDAAGAPAANLVEERADHLDGRQLFQPRDPIPNRLRQVADERLAIQRPFIAKGVVKAGAGDPHPFRQVADRGLAKALRPEAVHRRLQHRRLVELSRSRHWKQF